jgi:hypothetical protein
MRKLVALVLLLLVFSAGTGQAVEIGIGAKAGVNSSELTGELPEGRTSSSRSAPLLGMIVHMSFGSVFSLQGEVNYSSEGTKWAYQHDFTDSIWVKSPNDGGLGVLASLGVYDLEQRVSFTYFEIPLLAMLKIPTGGKLIPYAYAGPTIGFNFTASTDLKIAPVGEASFQRFLQGSVNNMKTVDFQGSIGAGLAYKISDMFATIDIRYTKSFSGVFDDADPNSFTVIDNILIPTVDYPIVDQDTGKAYDLKNEALTITISATGIL